MSDDLEPNWQEGDHVQIRDTFTTGDVDGTVADDEQIILPEADPPTPKRQVSIHPEDAQPLLQIKPNAPHVAVVELVVLVNEGDLFPPKDKPNP